MCGGGVRNFQAKYTILKIRQCSGTGFVGLWPPSLSPCILLSNHYPAAFLFKGDILSGNKLFDLNKNIIILLSPT